jgi:lipopolysaccharide/colanic/teichoic acid biosynthesis glycosyltransferase
MPSKGMAATTFLERGGSVRPRLQRRVWVEANEAHGLPDQATASPSPLGLSAAGWDAVYAVDVLASLVLCILTLPVLLLSLAWVMIVDPGNPFFGQTRIGLDGKPYLMFKVRSMFRDQEGHARFCSHGDPRIIPGGRWLRTLRIDELPQLYNVLLGHMALVGPRPEQPAFVATYLREIPRYAERHRVKPGITGLSQVTLGYVDSTRGAQKKLKYDLLYIEKRSVSLWFKIVLKTVKVIFAGHGAR